MTMTRSYHKQVIANITNSLDDINSVICGVYEHPKLVQKGIMFTRFVKGIYSFQMVYVSGDVEGVTGYTKEEFQNKDIIKLLKLSPEQLYKTLDQLESVGYCAKNTTFTRKEGYQIRVSSIIKKVAENTYEETTVLTDSFIEL